MLVTFKTKSYANITMLGDVGMKLLNLMNFGNKVPGGIVAEDISAALNNLQQGMLGIPKDITFDHDADEDDQPTVNLHTRALPLIELLQAAIADNNEVRWE